MPAVIVIGLRSWFEMKDMLLVWYRLHAPDVATESILPEYYRKSLRAWLAPSEQVDLRKNP